MNLRVTPRIGSRFEGARFKVGEAAALRVRRVAGLGAGLGASSEGFGDG